MNFNDLNSKIHLPSVVSYYGVPTKFNYCKIPGIGWYGIDSDGYVSNFLNIFMINHPRRLTTPPDQIMQEAYRFFSYENRSMLESPIVYSETTENRLGQEYLYKVMVSTFYKRCREEALEGVIRHNDKPVKLARLLEDLNMSHLMHAGIGVMNQRVQNDRGLREYPMQPAWLNKIVVPAFFTPDNRLAGLEVTPVQDLAKRVSIYNAGQTGWYGKPGSTIVGSIHDLHTNTGSTWDRKLAYWPWPKAIKLHHSLAAKQCLDIWLNSREMALDKSPLDVLKETNSLDSVKDHLKDLTLAQTRELEKLTNKPLYNYWIAQRYEETTISGLKFSCRDGRYYFKRNNEWLEFTNFIVNLTKITKEEGEFYQYGQVLMDGHEVQFRAKRKSFNTQYNLIQVLNDILIDAGAGIPTIAPNVKNYITNVINAFNPDNTIEKPATNPTTETKADLLSDI